MGSATGNQDEGHPTSELEEKAVEELQHDDEPNGKGEEEEQCSCYRLERLVNQLDNAVRLWPHSVFIKSVDAQVPTINREEFQYLFEDFLRELAPRIPAPAPKILDGLFQQAIRAKQEAAAWERTVDAIKSEEFSRSLDYLLLEVKRFATMRKLLIERKRRKTPQWMHSWEQTWIDAFEELEEEIAAQLRDAKKYLEALSGLAKLGRTDIQSHVLLSSKDSIQEVIAKTPLSKIRSVTLAALAYAAQLVSSDDDDNDAKGKYLDAIKARLTRAKRSKTRLQILATLLMTNCVPRPPVLKAKLFPPHSR